jgi:hypothetical protein
MSSGAGWSASAPGGRSPGSGLSTATLVIIVTVIVCAAALGIALITTRDSSPAESSDSTTSDDYNASYRLQEACLEGGGTWEVPIGSVAGGNYCVH